MEHLQFIELTFANTSLLFLIGLAGGLFSGFIGSSGVFILTPAMMSLGIPGILAVASNMAHKFPKALEGAYKRNRYGQVDIKLGLIIGVFAGIGVFLGTNILSNLQNTVGTGTALVDLSISIVLVIALAIVGILVLRDGLLEKRGAGRFNTEKPEKEYGALIRWVHGIQISGTMITFTSIEKPISLLILGPIGLAAGLLGSTIAVGGFIGVPAMIYLLGVSAMAASATEMVIAFIIGLGGSIFYALDGFLDIRLSLILIAGALFGIQIGATSATYARDHVVKFVMATILLLILVSRLFYIPGYLTQLGILALDASTTNMLDTMGQVALIFALFSGSIMILNILYEGINQRKLQEALASTSLADAAPIAAQMDTQLSPLGRFQRFLVASDGSDFSSTAVSEAINMAHKCEGELHLMTLVAASLEYDAIGDNVLKQELEKAQAHLDALKAQATEAGVTNCKTHLIHGQNIHQQILALADSIKADVIVMGRRGRRGLARMKLGHATALVIGKARCSVLVVPSKSHIRGRHILVATDGSRFGDAAAITATRLGAIYDSKVTVVSVTAIGANEERRTESWYAVGRAAGHMHDQGIDVSTRTLEGQADQIITELARDQNVDLIITGSHGRTGLDRVLIGSTSERILNHTECAVLVVKSS